MTLQTESKTADSGPTAGDRGPISADSKSGDRGPIEATVPIGSAALQGNAMEIAAFGSEKRPPMDSSVLAERWGISVDAAKRTLKRTTQKGVRNVLHPTLSRSYRPNDRHMRYHRLPVFQYGRQTDGAQ